MSINASPRGFLPQPARDWPSSLSPALAR